MTAANPSIAGIGARATPAHILPEMTVIGTWCRNQQIWVNSGHAIGADWAFEQGALDYCRVFLPWLRFGDDRPILGQKIVVFPSLDLDELIRKFHPTPDKLKRGDWALMRRNGCQVLGQYLDNPVMAIVCWSPGFGGTEQALRIARTHHIEILNMREPQFSTAVAVIERLQRIHSTQISNGCSTEGTTNDTQANQNSA